MKQSRFTDSQIMATLKQAEAGTPVPQLSREHGSAGLVLQMCAKYGVTAALYRLEISVKSHQDTRPCVF